MVSLKLTIVPLNSFPWGPCAVGSLRRRPPRIAFRRNCPPFSEALLGSPVPMTDPRSRCCYCIYAGTMDPIKIYTRVTPSHVSIYIYIYIPAPAGSVMEVRKICMVIFRSGDSLEIGMGTVQKSSDWTSRQQDLCGVRVEFRLSVNCLWCRYNQIRLQMMLQCHQFTTATFQYLGNEWGYWVIEWTWITSLDQHADLTWSIIPLSSLSIR